MSHSQPINYIVYSVREKTCTAPDRFVYFLDYYCIGQQGISSFILYPNQTATKRFVHAIFCDFACFLNFSCFRFYKSVNIQTCKSIILWTVHISMYCL